MTCSTEQVCAAQPYTKCELYLLSTSTQRITSLEMHCGGSNQARWELEKARRA